MCLGHENRKGILERGQNLKKWGREEDKKEMEFMCHELSGRERKFPKVRQGNARSQCGRGLNKKNV